MKLPSVLQAASANSSLIRREATDRTLMDLCLRPPVATGGDHRDVRTTQPVVRANP